MMKIGLLSILASIASLSLGVGNTIKQEQKENYSTEEGYMYRFDKPFDYDLISIEAWINIDKDLQGEKGGVIFGNYYNKVYPYGDMINIEVSSEGYIEFHYFARSGWTLTDTFFTFNNSVTNKVNTGKNVFLAITRTKSQVKLYLNGELKQVGSLTNNWENHSVMRYQVGVDYKNWVTYPKEKLHGSVSQLSLFENELSAQDVESDYLNRDTDMNKTERPGLVGNWYFNNWTTIAVEDTSGNGNDAKLCTAETWVQVEESQEFDHTLIVFPDVQTSTHYHPQKYLAQCQWVVDHKDEYNISMVNYVGDLVDNAVGASADAEWANFNKGIRLFYDAGVTWGSCAGNHDYDGAGGQARETTGIDSHVSFEEYSSQKYYAGNYEEGSFENTYFIYEVEGVKYININLEFGPRDQVLRWVDRLLDEYSDHRAIIVTHSYINTAGNQVSHNDHYAPSNYGYSSNTTNNDAVDMWSKCFSKHKNVFLIFSGHEASDDLVSRADMGENGNVVHEFLVDAQGAFASNGVDMIFILKMDETHRVAHCYWYCASENAYLNIQNQFAFSYDSLDPVQPTYEYELRSNNATYVKNNNSYIPIVVISIVSVTCLLGAGISLAYLGKKKGGNK